MQLMQSLLNKQNGILDDINSCIFAQFHDQSPKVSLHM